MASYVVDVVGPNGTKPLLYLGEYFYAGRAEAVAKQESNKYRFDGNLVRIIRNDQGNITTHYYRNGRAYKLGT